MGMGNMETQRVVFKLHTCGNPDELQAVDFFRLTVNKRVSPYAYAFG